MHADRNHISQGARLEGDATLGRKNVTTAVTQRAHTQRRPPPTRTASRLFLADDSTGIMYTGWYWFQLADVNWREQVETVKLVAPGLESTLTT